jgi:hypothetical protein
VLPQHLRADSIHGGTTEAEHGVHEDRGVRLAVWAPGAREPVAIPAHASDERLRGRRQDELRRSTP